MDFNQKQHALNDKVALFCHFKLVNTVFQMFNCCIKFTSTKTSLAFNRLNLAQKESIIELAQDIQGLLFPGLIKQESLDPFEFPYIIGQKIVLVFQYLILKYSVIIVSYLIKRNKT